MNRGQVNNRWFLGVEKMVVTLVIASFFFTPLSQFFSFYKLPVKVAEAAQVTIDATGYITNNTSDIMSGSQTVFIDDQTGYKFFRSGAQAGVNAGECVYRKSTDGGVTWNTPVLIDDQGALVDCESITVWYDRWTPNDFGNFIHVATLDSGSDDVFYNRIDTANSDTRLSGSTAINTNDANLQTSTWAAGANFQSITKATDGTLYVSLDDTTDSYVLQCTGSCNVTANWDETAGARPQELANDYSILVPLVGGDVMLVNRDISADDIRSKIWDDSANAWSATWTTIDANAPENATYDVGMALTVASSSVSATSSIYLAYTADNAALGTDDDIRTAIFGKTGWNAATADVLTNNAKGLTNVAIARDTNTGNIYVAYTGQTSPPILSLTGNVYWKSSTSTMGSWSTETGPINTGADDMYGIDLNISSNQRIYASWFDGSDDDHFGDTIADLVPGIIVSANGSQTAGLTAAFTNTHVGGSFVFAEQASSRDITSITISENGTVDGSTAVENIKLLYEMDTTVPYNCASVSYGGAETQFGSTDTNGFTGADGTSAFSGSSITVSTTSAMCVYVVLDVNEKANHNETLNIRIANPSTDVSVTNGGEVIPATAVDITGSTLISNDNLTQIHYHWRNDNGSETTATSKTSGVQDTSFAGYQRTPIRLRMEVSNEGGITSPAVPYRLEYALSTTTCGATLSGWTDVGATNDDWNMSNTANLTDGNNTTNIPLAADGAVTDENTTFLSPNGAVKDSSSQTGAITLANTQYTEFEYSITASTTAADGNTYCFRLTNAGTPLKTYSVYPSVTVTADVNVSVSGTQTSTFNIPSTNQYLGGAFVFTDATGSHTITSIKLTENGTVNAQSGLDNILLKYDLDITAPYNCASETYSGAEPQYGVTDTDGFSSANGTSTFSGTLNVSTIQTACVYVVADVTTSASNAETIEMQITNASTDVTLTSGGVSPSTVQALPGTSTLVGAVLTQSRYHWRNNNGTQATATSMTAGIENTPVTYVSQNTPVRLRMEVSNEGTITSPNTALRLEYGTKIASCSLIGTWTDVGAVGGVFDMFNSIHVTDGGNSTNISNTLGGVTDDNTTFKVSNSGLKDTSSQVATTTFTATEFIEAEFSLRQTSNAAFDTTYCFRVSNAGIPINAYTAYPELTTSPERDFEIQNGTTTVTGNSVTITAGVDYVAPASANTAFIRITNSHNTGAGGNVGGGTQNADDVTAYISNPSNILTSITFTRPTGAAGNTRVSWEIVEFIGATGSDNEMRVRSANSVTYGGTSLTATGTAATGVVSDSDVVVFITGQLNPDIGATNYNTGQSTGAWLASSDQPVFTRREAGADASIVSYAVVEFVGVNWKVQRVSHTYAAAGTTETESMTAVNSLSRTFVHSQKRYGPTLAGTDEFGAEVWLSSIGAVSFFLQAGATTPASHTSVAWIIENTQTASGAMNVFIKDGFTTGGVEPLPLNVALTSVYVLDDLSNTSIFASTRAADTTSLFPRPIAGFTLTASTTSFELWRSDTGAQLNYRVELVEWPTAGLTWRQNDYRFYVDNNALDPTDPWPLGTTTDLGENTVITGSDEPLGDQENIRIRMNLTVLNATFPELSNSFKLQYGERDTVCSAVSEGNWVNVGSTTSNAIWRGYNASGVSDGVALSTDPPSGGALNLTASDVAATYEEQNSSAINPFTVDESEDVEFDWNVQMNGASAETFYCFRMVKNDGSVISYSDYPQLRTSSYTPRMQNWRFYSDVNNETPTSALAAENSSPINFGPASTTKLRVTIKEIENIARDDVRFKLQYSEYADFSNNVFDVTSTSTCVASSTWCYFNGGGSDNAIVSTKVLTDADSCVASTGDGCGTHNESPRIITGFRHENSASAEYEFTLTAKLLRANAVYYFRLFDVVQSIPVPINTGETYPSLVAEGASLVFTTTGITSGTVIGDVTMDVTSTATLIPFGSLPFNTDYEAGYRLNINTNATEGYQVLMYVDQQLLNEYGSPIPPITGTNAVPTSWSPTGCLTSVTGCFGYHTTDGTLQSGFRERFGADDSYAQVSTSPEEVMYKSFPTNDTHDIVYRLKVTEEQASGQYETIINYIAVPVH